MTPENPTEPAAPPQSLTGKLVAIALPLLVLAGGGAIAWTMIATAPKADRQPPPRSARLVEVRAVEFAPQPTLLRAFGNVQAAREVVVYPRVTGEVVEMNPALIPGGHLEAEALLVRIDPLDFELTVRQREADLARAQATLALEMGQQSVAQREYELLGQAIPEESRDLVLRGPQLAQARATLAAAEAALDQAKLNLERTSIRAPFNATLRSRNVNVGLQVTPNTMLATLTGSDEYWIELTVPVDLLRWIRIPNGAGDRGSTVRVTSVSSGLADTPREGAVLRLLPDLEPSGRLARVLVSVPDPLALKPEHAGQPALILGDYVRAEIEGVGVPSAAKLDRRFFRDGDNVWLMNDRNELEIRPVTVMFRNPDSLLVTAGLTPGDRVVVTDLPAPMPGMALRTGPVTPDDPSRPKPPAPSAPQAGMAPGDTLP